jgi:hypothetical protein
MSALVKKFRDSKQSQLGPARTFSRKYRRGTRTPRGCRGNTDRDYTTARYRSYPSDSAGSHECRRLGGENTEEDAAAFRQVAQHPVSTR